jgi:hypothetical protein
LESRRWDRDQHTHRRLKPENGAHDRVPLRFVTKLGSDDLKTTGWWPRAQSVTEMAGNSLIEVDLARFQVR